MLEKPNLKDEKIIACLKSAYGLSTDEIAFLPLGADLMVEPSPLAAAEKGCCTINHLGSVK